MLWWLTLQRFSAAIVQLRLKSMYLATLVASKLVQLVATVSMMMMPYWIVSKVFRMRIFLVVLCPIGFPRVVSIETQRVAFLQFHL